MDSPRFGRSVRRITILEREPSGLLTPVTIYRLARARKKGSRLLRPVERAVRQWAEAADASATTYLGQHRRSNRKRPDGWLRDLPRNNWRAARKGGRQLKIYKVFGL